MAHEFADDAIADYVAHASLGQLDVDDMREGVAARAGQRGRGPEMARVLDVTAADRPARVYCPSHTDGAPVLLWLHGGGWTIGTLDSFDRVGRRLAAASELTVMVLDYRLSPEHPWPAAIDDSVEAVTWLAGAADQLGFRPTSVAIAGDSAGGTLAALTTLRLASEMPELRPDVLALCYANTDLAGDYPSRRDKGVGYGLDIETTEFFNAQWVPRARWAAPGVSPMSSTHLDRLPPTVIVTAEHDQLRDEGAAFRDRLHNAGIDVRYRCEPGLIHNFLMLDELSPAAADAANRFARDIAGLVATTTPR